MLLLVLLLLLLLLLHVAAYMHTPTWLHSHGAVAARWPCVEQQAVVLLGLPVRSNHQGLDF